jgi:hypothetical protein
MHAVCFLHVLAFVACVLGLLNVIHAASWVLMSLSCTQAALSDALGGRGLDRHVDSDEAVSEHTSSP